MRKVLILMIWLSGTMFSCQDVLEIEDINNYNPELVWNDANLANAYMANLYPMFGNWNPSADAFSQQIAGIPFYSDRVTITNGEFKLWNYTRIRLINQAIVEVNQGNLSEADKQSIMAQALFMRAYTYFDMVKYHGGVPYITIPQDRYEDDLFVKRNTTKECFDLMIKDLDDAIAMLPTKIAPGSDDYGKIDGSFALAFKAKVLLYMASPQFNPTNPWSNAYWQQAYSVNKEAYESLGAQGYRLVDDYSQIALSEKGPEAIFTVINSYPNKTASWDHGVRPGSESRGPAWAVPTWEFVKEFPMKDGKAYNDPSGAYFQTDAEFLQNFWSNRDPRFMQSVVWNGKSYPVSGKTDKRQYTALGIAHELDDYGINPDAGVNSTNLDRYTGFFIVKNSLLKLAQAEVQQYDVDYVLMRYAEVMLNYAETANETGHMDEAIQILQAIRARAGIEPGDDGYYGIDASSKEALREAILMERNIELCFEGHRFWDLRRLRMLDRLNGTTKHGVEAIAVLPNGQNMPMGDARAQADQNLLVEKDFKYSVLQVPRAGVQINVVPETYYFFPIHQDVLDRNPSLEQNNNWGGSFNPTLE
ncbi:putative outer membrane starch-binding protein [Dyadobacter jejuensis]|uniref:Putative outer membrane starch-binding protein n=1 Tax=Dyadobacter jejuensis TaxID=1082580 RepID=A0A316ACW4_9BACT|nr:RagB/SusD family nutrient uptake outer membrane protein [Dyadobacter jejuensis]PWJ55626.1 putative outer membrane starch-binding protein [Dyadobacter jejuensis]